MKRITTCTKGMLLACAALAFAAVGCTSSDSPNTGGLEATLTLDAGATEQQINTATVTISCMGTDPITGEQFVTETFPVNLATSEGNDPLDPKDTLGIFKKEGLPEGICTIEVTASTDDGPPPTMSCGGIGSVDITAGPTNEFITIVINCVSLARYGGVGVDGEFNQCAEYQQIIVSPTTQSVGNDVDVDIWCYDPDGDDATSAVYFVTAASVGAAPTNPLVWQTCTPDPNPNTPPNPQPYLGTCPHQDAPIADASGNLTAPSTDLQLTCDVSNVPCLVIVSVSDDNFGFDITDPLNPVPIPFGCDGSDDNATATIPVYCQGFAICGDGNQESPEDCDPCDAGLGNCPPGTGVTLPAFDDQVSNAWCGTDCKNYNPCDNPTAAPASCQTNGDLGYNDACAAPTCDDSTASIDCDFAFSAAGTACPQSGSGPNDGFCDGAGACQGCINDGQCDDGNSCTVGTCNTVAGTCSQAPVTDGTSCTAFGVVGSCLAGQCDLPGDCTGATDMGILCAADVQGIVTACALCETGGIFAGACPSGIPVYTPASVCIATLLPGFSTECTDCFSAPGTGVVACGTANCASECGPGPGTGPTTCVCLDCTYVNCDLAFEACAGYSTGVPDSGVGDGSPGGPPLCPSTGTCTGGRTGPAPVPGDRI